MAPNSTKKEDFAAGSITSSTTECGVCSKEHSTERCDTLASLDMEEKANRVKEMGLCFRCLGSGHSFRSCPSDPRCGVCGRRHNTIFHGRKSPGASRQLDAHVPIETDSDATSTTTETASLVDVEDVEVHRDEEAEV